MSDEKKFLNWEECDLKWDKYRKMLEEVQRRIKEDELEQLNYEIARKRNKKNLFN